EVHQGGLRVYTTLNAAYQKAATRAVLDGLAAYERRHGWKAGLKNVGFDELNRFRDPDWSRPMEIGSYAHGLVTQVSSYGAIVKLGRFYGTLTSGDIRWTGKRTPEAALHVGDVVYVRVVSFADGRDPAAAGTAKLSLEQESGIQGALL